MDLLHRLALARVQGVGNVLYRRLVEAFGSPEAVFSADRSRLTAVPGVGPQTAQALASFDGWKEVEQEIERIESFGAVVLPLEDPGYPARLREIHDAPPHLYVRGQMLPKDALAVAVVGSREASPYGSRVTRKFAGNLARAGVTVVSGLAKGIDAYAHRGALDAGGRTIAVLGCGVDVDFPRNHGDLAKSIALCGAVVSEFPMGAEPRPENFPKRNRIISGLSLAVVVVEAGARSGSLITAAAALDQGRDVFAVPGNIDDPRSIGSNWLIKQGARLVDSADDVIEQILPQALKPGREEPEPAAIHPASAPGLSAEERLVLTKLGLDPIHIDELTAQSGIPSNTLAGMLLTFELRGFVEQLPGKYFRLIVRN